MPADTRAAAVARRAVELGGALGVDLPTDVALFRLAGGRPVVDPVPGEPDELGHLLEASTSADQRLRQGVHFTPVGMATELATRAWPASGSPSVGDPACGGGALLLAAGRRLVADGATPQQALRQLWGADLDPLAVATTEATLTLWAGHPVPAGQLIVADSLVDDLGWPPLDLVLGNPPFLSQLASTTASDRPRVAALRGRFGEAVQAYTDPAGLFLLLGTALAGSSGRIGMVLPQSLLGTRDADALRRLVGERAHVVDLWVPSERFAAAVDVVLAVLEVGAARDDRPWTAHLAARLGVPSVELDAGAGTIGDRATVMASFRQEYYGLLPGLAERADAPGARPVVTTGRIDLGAIADRPSRIGRRAWRDPVVQIDLVDGRARQWLDRTAVPKLLLATQTKVVEVAVDEAGDVVPVTPVIAVTASADELWSLAAALASPAVSAWAATRAAGTALSPGALRMTAPLVRQVPLPSDAEAWVAGTAAFRAGDLDAFAVAMAVAYDVAPEVIEWWRPLAKRVWSPRR